ncbi:MAG: four helix bundle protein [Flavobacteriaceae bacterium]|nr:four helix bundle protein [Flavobacteriaceae bacterium]
MYTFSFEKLTVWKDSVKLVKDIYMITERFPDKEKFGLISQIRRATISISSNLAEGLTRDTKKDKKRFITIAYGSTMEILNQLIIAKELDYISEERYLAIRSELEKISNKLNALKKSI